MSRDTFHVAPFQRLKVRVAAVLPAVPLLLQALPNTEELEATPVFESMVVSGSLNRW